MKQTGLTIVETLIVLAILFSVISIVLPGYSALSARYKLTSVTNHLLVSIAYARTEAIRRGVRVSICKSASRDTSNFVCQSTASWKDGWIIFVDRGVVGSVDGDDEILRLFEYSASDIVVTTSNFTNYLSYMPTGRSKGANNLSNGSINFCLNGAKWSVVLNITGRARLAKAAC